MTSRHTANCQTAFRAVSAKCWRETVVSYTLCACSGVDPVLYRFMALFSSLLLRLWCWLKHVWCASLSAISFGRQGPALALLAPRLLQRSGTCARAITYEYIVDNWTPNQPVDLDAVMQHKFNEFFLGCGHLARLGAPGQQSDARAVRHQRLWIQGHHPPPLRPQRGPGLLCHFHQLTCR